MHSDSAGVDHAMHHQPPSGDADDDSGIALGGEGSCSVCGVCCTGVSVGPTLPVIAVLAIASAAVPFTPSLYAGVDLDHAERPPLTFILA